MVSPCMNCKDRKISCHDDCDKYQEWKSQFEKRKKKIKDSGDELFLHYNSTRKGLYKKVKNDMKKRG